MDSLRSFFQTAALAILAALACLSPFCDSFRLLLDYHNGTGTSFKLVKEYVRSTHKALHSILENNMELFIYILVTFLAIRHLVVPMVQHVDNILDRIYRGVSNSILQSYDAVHHFVDDHFNLPARLSRLEEALAKKTSVTIKVGSNRRAMLLERQLKCAKRHLSKRTIGAAHNMVTITNLTAENLDYQGKTAEHLKFGHANVLYAEIITKLKSNESDLQKQLLESKEAIKECLRQNNERLTNMATSHAEALKVRDEDIATLKKQLAECHYTQNKQATDASDRLVTTVAQKDKVIAASRNEITALQQQLADCKTPMESNAVYTRNHIATVIDEKNVEAEQIR